MSDHLNGQTRQHSYNVTAVTYRANRGSAAELAKAVKAAIETLNIRTAATGR